MKLDPQTQLYIKESETEQRDISDNRYSVKLVERIVFAGSAAIGTGLIATLIHLVWKN